MINQASSNEKLENKCQSSLRTTEETRQNIIQMYLKAS